MEEDEEREDEKEEDGEEQKAEEEEQEEDEDKAGEESRLDAICEAAAERSQPLPILSLTIRDASSILCSVQSTEFISPMIT